jgi:hypothetical protein
VGYGIVIVHTDDAHFVTWINRMAVHPERSLSTDSLKVQEWSSAMKRLRLRGTMPNNNPLANNMRDKSIPSVTSLTNDVTQKDIPDSTNNHQVQNDRDISFHLRSKTLSVENPINCTSIRIINATYI